MPKGKATKKHQITLGGDMSEVEIHVDNPAALMRARSFDSNNEERQARALRAVNKFKTLLPVLNGLAKAMTHDPSTRVVMGTGTYTDGKTIYLRPMIALGDIKPGAHPDRRVCGMRDEHSRQLCEVCRAEEHVMVDFYHELSHIIEGSFAAIENKDALAMLRAALEERKTPAGTARADKIAAKLEAFNVKSYIAASNVVSPFIGTILNAWEDAYVNTQTFNARPGTRAMFAGDEYSIIAEGMEQNDGSIAKWSEADPTAQAICGLFAKAAGYDYAGWFAPEVEEFLDSPEANALVFQFRTSRSVKARYRLAFPTLETLRSRGYARRPDDAEDDPEPTMGEPDADQEAEEGQPGDSGDQPSEPQPGGAGGFNRPDLLEDDDNKPQPSQSRPAPKAEPEAAEPEEDDAGDPGTDEDAEADEDGSGAGDGDEDELSDDEADEAGAGSQDDGSDDEDGSGDTDDADADSGDDTAGKGSGSVLDGYHRDPDDDDDEDDTDLGDDPFDDDDDESDDGDLDDEDDDQSESVDNTADIGDSEYKPDLFSDPDKVAEALAKFGGHSKQAGVGGGGNWQEEQDNLEVMKAVMQGEFFDAPSEEVFGVQLHRWNKHIWRVPQNPDVPPEDVTISRGWRPLPATGMESSWRSWLGADVADFGVPESLLTGALLKMRTVFQENRKSAPQRNHKSGRIDASKLGRRVAVDDPRVFYKRREPGRKDWFVTIGGDISGSTMGFHANIWLLKKAMLAQGDLLHRIGIPFAMYAHSSGGSVIAPGSSAVDIYCVKEPNEPWGPQQRERLVYLTSNGGNLDGHSLEFYRKITDKSNATDKIIMYYTDGAMPAENYEEELKVLKREIKACAERGYLLVGVGIKTNSPKDHGLDTIRINKEEDVHEVIDGLKARILAKMGSAA